MSWSTLIKREREREISKKTVSVQLSSSSFLYLHNDISHLFLLAEEDVCGSEDKTSHVDIVENGVKLQAEVRVTHAALAKETAVGNTHMYHCMTRPNHISQ